MLSLIQVLIAALVGVIASLVVLWLYGRSTKQAALPLRDAVLVAIVVGISILLYRLGANTPMLNDDPVIPVVSPNDVLCPVITYVSLEVLAGFRSSLQRSQWARIRALLTLVSLMVNVVTI